MREDREPRPVGLLWKLVAVGLGCLVFVCVLWSGTTWYFVSRTARAEATRAAADHVWIQLLEVERQHKNVLLRDVQSVPFHELRLDGRRTPHLLAFDIAMESLYGELDTLEAATGEERVAELRAMVERYDAVFEEMVELYAARGFKDWGLVGDWRDAIHDYEQVVTGELSDVALERDMLLLRRHEKDFLLRGEAKYLVRVRTQLGVLRADTALRGGERAAALLSELERYERAFREYCTLSDRIGATDEDGLRGELSELSRQMGPLVGEIRDDAEAQGRSARRQMALAGVITVVLGMVVASSFLVLLSRNITRPLQHAATAARRIAGRDLTGEARGTARRDELGVLSRSIADMAGELRGQLRAIRDSAQILASSASGISSSSQQVVRSATRTSLAVQTTSTVVEQVQATAHATSDLARKVATQAEQTRADTEEGRVAAARATEMMREIEAQILHIERGSDRLEERSQAIGEVVAAVDGLANQSNLLAVNAAIEAANAGVHGKGFGIVAQEIRALADRSRTATAQVRSMLEEIRQSSVDNVAAAELGVRSVRLGLAQTDQASAAITSVAAGIHAAADSADHIAAASREQLGGMGEVAEAVATIHDTSVQNLESAEELARQARRLDDLGRRLMSLVERYQL